MQINSEKLVFDFIKKKSFLTTNQQECVEETLAMDYQWTYPQIAQFIAPQIGATEMDVYFFLLTRDKDNRRDNDYNKIQ
jgi:hypothetical protein